ncbi:hypothetical protein BDV96DRAFT_63752 [Lophiotrema nucula]|uniref:Uncharacterized protein n=1 Tax=Lophiotrema nucula TaxID=690887 RepID=A0A6A5Z812_9PLEO|nr:hypothetical protein BDV96DRAFT_63752 [Lophiotrema nucula]
MMFALRPVSRWLDHVTDVLFAILLFSQLVKYCKADKPFNCAGGSIYFVAHPVDTLLYQSPDIYHDFYVYKCVTTVVFTTGDRGLDGNFTNSLERGLQAAYAFMAGVEEKEATWDEDKVEVGDKKVLLRSLNKAPNVQVIYLRLPGGKPDGQGFDSNHGETLKKLYQGSFMTVTTTDEATTYTLEQLRAVISGILKQRKAVDIRIMDKTAAIAKDNQKECEHADHSTSARIVSDVIAQDEIEGKVLRWASSERISTIAYIE